MKNESARPTRISNQASTPKYWLSLYKDETPTTYMRQASFFCFNEICHGICHMIERMLYFLLVWRIMRWVRLPSGPLKSTVFTVFFLLITLHISGISGVDYFAGIRINKINVNIIYMSTVECVIHSAKYIEHHY